MMKNNTKDIKEFLFNVGLMIIFFIFLTIFVSSTLFFVKISINKYTFLTSLALTYILSTIILVKKKNNIKKIGLTILTFSLILLSTILISANTYDLSWDGNSYHKAAIGELKNGWNPLYEGIEDFNMSEDNILKLAGTHDIWCNHYAKGQWIFAANVYSITNNIESGKCINLLAMVSVLLISLSYFISKINVILGILISLLLAINPITLMQMFTYYNDMLIYSFIIILLICMQNIIENKNIKTNYLLLFFSICILINIKFTGLAYAGFIMVIYYIYIIFKKQLREKNIKFMTFLGIISVIIGIFLIGSSTYVKNFIDHGHPLYPLFGENKQDIMTSNQPAIFSQMNRIEKFIYANFSKSQNLTAYQQENPTLKIPLTYTEAELYQLSIPDLRIGGFGVLFGGILIISIIVIIIGLYFLYFKNKKLFAQIGIIIGTITLLILILDESWWARYMPQLYVVPIVAILILYIFKGRKINIIMLSLISILLIINTGIIIRYNTIVNIKKFNEVKTELKTLKNDESLLLYTTDFNGAMFNIYDINKNIKILLTLDDAKKESKLYYNNMIEIIEKRNDYQ